MKGRLVRSLARVVIAGSILIVPYGCAIDAGAGYGYEGSMDVGVDYYEPLGFDYGNWGPAYGGVAPYRNRAPRAGRGGGGPPGHGYRPAPPTRAMPSIPSGARSGRGGSSGGSRR